MEKTWNAPDEVERLLAEAARQVPTTALMTGLGEARPGGVDGRLLADGDWLEDQLARTARRWRTRDTRVAGTLWWYSATTALLAPPLVTGFVAGRAADPGPAGIVLYAEETGRLAAVRPTRLQTRGEAAAPALRHLLDVCIGTLVSVTGMRPRPLWSVAGDALANVLLRTGRESGRCGEATARADSLAAAIGDPLPRPRWCDVPVPDGGDGLFPAPPPTAASVERFVRRGSCCLIYEAEGEEKCLSCPRRSPADRAVRLEIAASRLACSASAPPGVAR